MFEQVKNEILSIGFEEILSIPRSSDPKIELAVVLLNDAGNTFTIRFSQRPTFASGINAYWSPSPLALTDMVGLTVSSVQGYIGYSILNQTFSASNWH